MKNTAELHKMSEEELNASLISLRKDQFKLRLKKASGSLENPHVFKTLRRAVARVKTILNQKAGNSND